MEDVKIILSILWVACMLCYLLGDVLRIFSGNFEPGKIEGKPMTQNIVLGMAVIMMIPIIMAVLSVIIESSANYYINIIVAIIFILFNIVGMKGMKIFDKFLIFVSFGFNILIVWYAWTEL
jgi:hypothetical protein